VQLLSSTPIAAYWTITVGSIDRLIQSSEKHPPRGYGRLTSITMRQGEVKVDDGYNEHDPVIPTPRCASYLMRLFMYGLS
jgi:hypothetical protein